tara:strand:+ start:458 stop:898 length:441 start_codon:yes stop_codon:yes gene_type:complete
MKFLKYLILGIILSTVPACAAVQEVQEVQRVQVVQKAQGSAVTWSKGDKIAAFYICRTEEDIMEVALADVKGGHALRQSIFRKTMTRDCINLNPPLGFTVQNVIGSYVDSNKKETSILAISIPDTEKIVGYVISIGKPISTKALSY